MKPPMFDVAVAGGGVIGAATAWRLAQTGRRVVMIDNAEPGAATQAAGGMLAPVSELRHGEEDLHRLGLASAALYPEFVAELEAAAGIDTGYHRCGTLAVGFDADDAAEIGHAFEYQESLGLDVARMTGSECRRLEPVLATSVRGGMHVADDHQVDPRRLLEALGTACERAGVETIAATVNEVAAGQGDAVCSLGLASHQSVKAGQVVVATGSWTPRVGGIPPGITRAVRPVKGQLLRMRAGTQAVPLERTLRCVVRGQSIYLIPRADGRVLVGATVEEMGYDTAVTAGGVYDLLRDATQVVPGLKEFELEEVATGLRPGSVDNAPLIGKYEMPGAIIASGHYRNGILLAPVTAAIVAEIVETGQAPPIAAAFAPTRFASRSASPTDRSGSTTRSGKQGVS